MATYIKVLCLVESSFDCQSEKATVSAGLRYLALLSSKEDGKFYLDKDEVMAIACNEKIHS